MLRTKTILVGISTSLVLGLAPVASAGTATLDPTFATNGVLHLANTQLAVVDEMSVVGGSAFVGGLFSSGSRGHGGLAVANVTNAGSLNPSYGKSGVAHIKIPGRHYLRSGMTVAPDGSSVIVGQSHHQLWIARFTAAGIPDVSFSGDGIRSMSVDAPRQYYDDPVVATDSAGRTSFAVMESGKSGPNVLVTRLLPGGARDSSFAGDGSRRLNYGDWDFVDALAVDARDRVLVGTDVPTSRYGTNIGVITRLRTNGTFDHAFSSDGHVRFRLAPKMFTYPTAIEVDAGSITAGLTSGGTAYGALRMNSSGALDPNYGEGGILGLTCDCVAIDADVVDGQVAITGSRSDGSTLAVRISRSGTTIKQDHIDFNAASTYVASAVAISGQKTLISGSEPKTFVARTN